MGTTLLETLRATQNPFSAAVLKELVMADQMLPLIPMVPYQGLGFTYQREVSIGSFAFLPDSGGTIAESTGADETITVQNRQAAADFYVQAAAMEFTAEYDKQLLKKAKKAGQVVADKVINGGNITGFTLSSGTIFTQGGAATTPYIDTLVAASSFMDSNRDGPGSIKYTHTGTLLQFRAPGDREYGATVDTSAGDGTYTVYSVNPSKWITVTIDASDATADTEALIRFTSSTNDFDGLEKLIPPGQVRASTGGSGDALSLNIMDELIHSVYTGNNRYFVMNAKLIRKFSALIRGAGGATMMELATGVQVPSYMGIPILRNDNIPSDEVKSATTLSSVYLVSLEEDEGVYMGALGGETFNVDADPREAALMGFRAMNLGPIQDGTKGNVVGGRLAFYGGLALGSTKSAARAKEIVTA
jgi:hypothetical protein